MNSIQKTIALTVIGLFVLWVVTCLDNGVTKDDFSVRTQAFPFGSLVLVEVKNRGDNATTIKSITLNRECAVSKVWLNSGEEADYKPMQIGIGQGIVFAAHYSRAIVKVELKTNRGSVVYEME